MRARSFTLYLSVAVLVSAFGRDQEKKAGLSLEELRGQIVAHVSQDRFRGAQWGIKILSLRSGETVFETNSTSLLKPASNAKIFTGALALDVLGRDYRIRTSLYAKDRPQAGVLRGDLVVYGRGDPTFSSVFDAKDTSGLRRLAQAIQQAGIQRIEGDLIGDSTFFSGPQFGTGWTWDDLQYYYGAEVSALTVQDNVLDLAIRPGEAGAPCSITAKSSFVELINRTRTGAPKSRASISIERPVGQNRAYVNGTLPKGFTGAWTDTVSVSNAPLWFTTLLKEELTRSGIVVSGQARAVSWPDSAAIANLTEIGRVESLPLGLVVQRMLKVSQNLYAQLLLLQAAANGGGENVTEEAGIKRLNEFLGRAGISRREVLLDDGSGLSRSALVTPNAMVQLLRFMARHQEAETFRAGLPEAGTDGTLRTRLKDLKGRLRAKTGSFRYVDTLSGYLTTAGGNELAFAILLNAYDPPNGQSSREDVDTIARLAARLE